MKYLLVIIVALLAIIAVVVITGYSGMNPWLILPATVILFREVFVSGLREFLGADAGKLKVTKLAKWKTTFQMVCLGALILGRALPGWTMTIAGLVINVPHTVGLTTLWAAAALTVITGWDYLRIGLRHMD